VVKGCARQNPHWDCNNDPEGRAALELTSGDYVDKHERGTWLQDALTMHVVRCQHIADPRYDLDADSRLCELHAAGDR
jgi:hypothetical protein